MTSLTLGVRPLTTIFTELIVLLGRHNGNKFTKEQFSQSPDRTHEVAGAALLSVNDFQIGYNGNSLAGPRDGIER